MDTNISDLQQFDKQAFVITNEMLKNEFDYMIAQQMLKNMLKKGLISQDEFNKISVLNCEKFLPELTSIMPTNT